MIAGYGINTERCSQSCKHGLQGGIRRAMAFNDIATQQDQVRM